MAPISSEQANDSILLVTQESGCDESEIEQSSKDDVADTAVYALVVDPLQSIQPKENICTDDVNVRFSMDIAIKSELKSGECANSITCDVPENPSFEQRIADEIHRGVTIGRKSIDIEKKALSQNVSNNDFEDAPANGESHAENASTAGSSELLLSNRSTPTTKSTNELGEEKHIYNIVHDVMAAVDELFECFF